MSFTWEGLFLALAFVTFCIAVKWTEKRSPLIALGLALAAFALLVGMLTVTK